MKPLGTITMCLPHVDEEARRKIESAMAEAENYADFTVRLCDVVCSETTSPLTEYFAYFFPFHISDYNLTDRLEKEGRVPDLAGPLAMITKYRRGFQVEWDEMKHSLRKALNEAPNDWVACHLYIKWRYYAEFNFPECDVDAKVVDRITDRVGEDEDLDFFSSYLLRFKAIRSMFDMRTSEEIELVNQALEISKQHDEQVAVADLLYVLGGIMKFIDEKQGMDLFIASRRLSEELGYRYKTGQISLGIAHLKGQRGEIDAAIELIHEFREVRESLGLSIFTVNGLLALYHNIAGDGENAIIQADTALSVSDTPRRLTSFALAQKAWALINLGRADDATEVLRVSQELSTKSGVVWYWFLWYHLAEGLLDKLERRFDNALTTFEDVLNYAREGPIRTIEVLSLLYLTEVEIESGSSEGDSSGPWMQELEEFIQEKDVPGFAAYAEILKARFYQKQGRFAESRQRVIEGLKSAESPSMKYLRKLATNLLPDMMA